MARFPSFGVVMVLVGAIVATACAPAAPQPAGQTAPATERRAADQTLRFGRPGFPTSASPESSSANNQIFGAQFDTLTTLDARFQLQPWAATRWELLPNDEGWRFFLRRDLQFSNGDALTAADVEFTVNLLLTAQPPLPQRGVLPRLRGSRVVDPYTIDLLTGGRDSSLLSGTPYLFILPRAYYERVGRDQFALRPVGSGPYELVEFRPADTFRYRLRQNYTHPFRRPQATEIIWRAIPEATQLLNGLRVNELDIVWTGPSPEQADQARQAGFTVLNGDFASSMIAIDQAAARRSTPALLDRRVRLALNYAIDRDTINRSLYRGTAQPLNQIAIPGTPAFATDIPAIPFNQAEARRLLAEAGYPNGFRIANPIDFINGTVNAQFVQAVQDYWRQIGVEVGVNGLELGVWVDKFYNRNNQTRNELITSGGSDVTGNLLFFRQFVTCNQPPERVIWCVPAFDPLMDQAYAEPDVARSADLIRQAVRAHQQELTYIYVLAVPQYVLTSPKVRGVSSVTPATFWFPDAVYKID